MVSMNKFKDPAVYALYVDDGVYRYIGSTTGNSQNRLWEHIYRGRNGHDSPVYQWMREVGVENVRVIDLEKVPDITTIKEVEARWIKLLLDEGHDLTNQMARDGKPNSNGPRMKEINSRDKKGKPTWIKGKTGDAAGWTDKRRARQAETVKNRNQ